MAALVPFAAILCGIAAIGLLLASFWRPIAHRIERFGKGFSGDMEMIGMSMEPWMFGFIVVGSGAGLWLIALVLLSPPLPVGIGMFVLSVGGALLAARTYVRRRKASLIAKFRDQLEGSLRTLAGGVRVGLGIQQAIVLVGEQSREPARREFTRVVGLTNLGLSIFDAFDQLAIRMSNPETGMLARVMRVQAQTGGDLASVLENLADTIRDRRRFTRKVSAITSQGRATGWLLGFIPIGVGIFLVVAEPILRDAMFQTVLGRILLGASLGLDALAIFSLSKITKIEA